MTRYPTLLLTRPQAQSEGFAQACRAAGWPGDILIAPVMAIVPRPMPHRPDRATTLIFTSANGVHQASAQHDLTGFTAFAVGDKTAQVARQAGLTCTSAKGSVEDLLALVAQTETGPLLHLCGAHSTGDVAGQLRAIGKSAQAWVIYDQIEQSIGQAAQALLHGAHPVILPLFSPRSASLLSQAATGATAPITAIAISAAAAAAWTGPNKARIISRPNATEMVTSILSCAKD